MCLSCVDFCEINGFDFIAEVVVKILAERNSRIGGVGRFKNVPVTKSGTW